MKHRVKQLGRIAGTIALSALANGCSTFLSPAPQYGDYLSPAQAAGGERVASGTRVATGSLLVGSQTPSDVYGAYGYILMSRPDSEAAMPRLVAAAKAFTTLDRTESFAPEDFRQTMPTFWMLRNEPESFHATAKPEELVANYHFGRANSMLAAINMGQKKGPVLVAWERPFEKRHLSSSAIVFDLSSFSERDMQRALSRWTNQIARDPAYWNDGFTIVKIRETMRSFVLTYGESILQFLPGS